MHEECLDPAEWISPAGVSDAGRHWLVFHRCGTEWRRCCIARAGKSMPATRAEMQFVNAIDTPIFLLFDPTPAERSQTLPLKVYEAALAEGGKENQGEGKFVQLEYGIETGEAERIAVDGVSRGGLDGGGEENSGEFHGFTEAEEQSSGTSRPKGMPSGCSMNG